jgi:hypothetical protein
VEAAALAAGLFGRTVVEPVCFLAGVGFLAGWGSAARAVRAPRIKMRAKKTASTPITTKGRPRMSRSPDRYAVETETRLGRSQRGQSIAAWAGVKRRGERQTGRRGEGETRSNTG